ncbi:MAG: hypothetical protein ACLQMT_11845 [Candidatus Acidiferrales bacterium]
MPTDTRRTECTLDNDSRLLAGFAAIVSTGARRAGLAEADQENFAAAVMECCREAFALVERKGSRDSALHIAIENFPGRVEATIDYAGRAPAGVRNSPCQCAASESAPTASPSPHAASAQYETNNGRCRVTLTQRCGEVKARMRD